MVVLIVRRAWPIVVPQTNLAVGLYFGLLLMAMVGGTLRLQAGLANWGIARWQRWRADQPLSAAGEALLILLGFTVIWMLMLVLIVLLARALPA